MGLEEFVIKESEFDARMEAEVMPFISSNIHDGYFSTKDGARLHYQYLIKDGELGTIFISHGYCEFITKFYEIMYYFYHMGYSVFMVEHRGHGFSTRMVKSLSKVHIRHFEQYVEDYDAFVREAKSVHKSDHYYLFAHSMGGAIGALYLEGYPGVFEKAILTSPMMEMNLGDASEVLKLGVKLVSHLPGVSKLYLPGHHDYDGSYKYPACSSISEARYRYHFGEREREEHYQMNGASFSWSREAINVSKKILKNANLVKIPVILFQATEDHLVLPGAQNEFARLSGNTRLVRVEGSKHEIFNATDEIIINYYKTIRDFLTS